MDEATLKLGAVMLFFVAIIGLATTLSAWFEQQQSWLCYCGAYNALGTVQCLQCGRWRNQKR